MMDDLAKPARSTSIAILCLGFLIGITIVATQTWQSPSGLLDLRIYVGAASGFRSGASIYSYADPVFGLGSTYPPLWSLLWVPLSYLDIHLLEFAWTVANLTLWLATLHLLAWNGEGQLRQRRYFGGLNSQMVSAVWLASIPTAAIWNTLNQGQINILLWFLITLDLALVGRRSKFGGVSIGIAAALKLVPGLAILFLAVAGCRRAALNAALAAIGCFALGFALAPDATIEYATSVLPDTSRIGNLADSQNNSIRGLIERASGSTASHTLWLVLAGVTALAGAVIFRYCWRRSARISCFACLGICTALISPISWTHHLVPLAALLLLVLGARAPRWRVLLLALVVELILIDPIGWGRSSLTSNLRVLAMVAVLAFLPNIARREAAMRYRPSALPTRTDGISADTFEENRTHDPLK